MVEEEASSVITRCYGKPEAAIASDAFLLNGPHRPGWNLWSATAEHAVPRSPCRKPGQKFNSSGEWLVLHGRRQSNSRSPARNWKVRKISNKITDGEGVREEGR